MGETISIAPIANRFDANSGVTGIFLNLDGQRVISANDVGSSRFIGTDTELVMNGRLFFQQLQYQSALTCAAAATSAGTGS
jgi:hypothetical protein